jgi:hypothetical protein
MKEEARRWRYLADSVGNAAHIKGNIAKKASELRLGLCSSSGLKATRPTAIVAA